MVYFCLLEVTLRRYDRAAPYAMAAPAPAAPSAIPASVHPVPVDDEVDDGGGHAEHLQKMRTSKSAVVLELRPLPRDIPWTEFVSAQKLKLILTLSSAGIIVTASLGSLVAAIVFSHSSKVAGVESPGP